MVPWLFPACRARSVRDLAVLLALDIDIMMSYFMHILGRSAGLDAGSSASSASGASSRSGDSGSSIFSCKTQPTSVVVLHEDSTSLVGQQQIQVEFLWLRAVHSSHPQSKVTIT